MSQIKQNSFLLIEDPKFYQSFTDIDKCFEALVTYADNLDDAKILLQDTTINYNCVCLNSEIYNGQALNLLSECHQLRAGIPIYLNSENFKGVLKKYTKAQLGISGTFSTADDVAEIVKIIDSSLKKFDYKKVIDLNQSSQLSEEDINIKEHLVPIQALNFLSGSISFFDVFVKIRSGKFVKILDAGDTFDVERVNKYIIRGLTYLWIKKDAQKAYIGFCNKLTSKIIKSKSVSDGVKVGQTLNQGEEVIKFLEKNGLDQESLEFVQDYSKNITALIDNLASNNKSIDLYVKNVTIFKHSIGTALVAGLLGRKMGHQSAELLEILGVSATLHDIGLCKLKNLYEDGDNDYLAEEDILAELNNANLSASRRRSIQKIYDEHPTRGSEIISKMKNINPIVAQVVAEHHERIDDSGFPQLIKASMINPYAQIVGVADEFSLCLKSIKSGKNVGGIQEFMTNMSGFSPKVQRIWCEIFLKT